jgi:hypothetical protein
MKIFKELNKLGYKHYTEHTVEELDELPLESKERIMEQSLVLRFFREKYNIQCSINFYSESLGVKKVPNHYEIQIDYLSNNIWCYFENIDNKIYLTYEEAELDCIKKLIELCKNN